MAAEMEEARLQAPSENESSTTATADGTEEHQIVPFENEQGTKRPGAQDRERQAKRPRWGDKAFEEITIGDVERIVRKCQSLEKQVEANSDAVQQLKEAQKKEKELEKQRTEVNPNEVAQTKAAIAKQFQTQMLWMPAWNADLKKDGRELQAFIPNVSPQLLKELGGEFYEFVQKRTKMYFDKPVTKSIPATSKDKPAGSALVLGPWLTLKYTKGSCELMVKATYKLGVAEKKGKGKGRGKAKAAEAEATQDNEKPAEERSEVADDREEPAEEAGLGDDDESESGEEDTRAPAAPPMIQVLSKVEELKENGLALGTAGGA